MSDGPHKSLNMRRGWKRFAENADEAAFSPEEVCDAIPTALIQDWRAENLPSLIRQMREFLHDSQTFLFGNQHIEKLEALRNEDAGYPLSSTLLDCAVQAVADGKIGEGAITEATAAMLMDRTARGIRQVEEHYCRKSSSTRSVNVRERMNEGATRTDFTQLAKSFLGTGSAERLKQPAKQSGLDEGVSL